MSDGSQTAAPDGVENTAATGESVNTSEGQGASQDGAPDVTTAQPHQTYQEGVDFGAGVGKARKEKEILKRYGVRTFDELDEKLVKADARAKEVAEKAKQERATKSAIEDELSNALARVKELEAAHSERDEELSMYRQRSERALLDRVSAAAANHSEHRVLPGAMDLFVAAVRDRVRWDDDGNDVVVIATTPDGNVYVDKTKSLADLVSEVYEQRQFLFEPSGRKGAGSDPGPAPSQSASPFASGDDGFRQRIAGMKRY